MGMSNPGLAGLTTQAAAGGGSRLQQISAFIATLAGTAVSTFGAVQALRQSPAAGQAYISPATPQPTRGAEPVAQEGTTLRTGLLVAAAAALAAGAALVFRKKS